VAASNRRLDAWAASSPCRSWRVVTVPPNCVGVVLYGEFGCRSFVGGTEAEAVALACQSVVSFREFL
jgi:hypothetical protein